ncbi:rhodanese-like domain-containing protein [Lactococcus petauri]|uniref:rhodanese-like domain-containing protein n=1 Tax=Lactococcus petauri TaxID=1940789 RepID=UPI00232E54F5|nr:rhodanese-like domain-containing protein [Lactococcus petauri]MDC0814949.1 rhodanese-like domain-containing protein [Lactococcus petauri]MDC0816992.1 rhodanese-like domain-containing protein [Lactococcus petauri]MDC0824364.1 rhodanese-like domain-containing protein [Lactococcus petauri]MDC0831003.1 rhodanese-like domain-containing protein [Lactococcus petauri]
MKQLKEKLGQVALIDVREEDEYLEGHVPTAINMPLSVLEQRYLEIEDESYIICQSGMRSMRPCQFLEAQGVATTNVTGGILSWDQELEK